MQSINEHSITLSFDPAKVKLESRGNRILGLAIIFLGIISIISIIILIFIQGKDLSFWLKMAFLALFGGLFYFFFLNRGKNLQFIKNWVKMKPIKITIAEGGVVYFYQTSQKKLSWEDLQDIERFFWKDEEDPAYQNQTILHFPDDEIIELSEGKDWIIYQMIVGWTKTSYGEKVKITSQEEFLKDLENKGEL